MKKETLMLLLMVLLVGSCGENKESQKKRPTRVQTEVASSKAVQVHGARSDGQTYVGIVEEREATAVSFTGMGVVKRLLVDEGQPVARGQLIAVMDDTQARNVLSGAEAAMTQANDAQKRYGMLHDAGSLPEVQWVEIQSKVAQAKSQLDVARKNLADCQLRAPVGGIIGRRQVGAGETAMPSQAVVSILDISTVKVKVSIPEAEIGQIQDGTPSNIKVEAIDRTYTGGRIEKGVQADALTHTYDVFIHVANGDRKLLPGMVASVSFRSPTVSLGKPLLPVAAVQKKADGGLFVWVVGNDSTAHRQQVDIGEMMGNRVTVTAGINEGQRVVTEGYQKLSEGTKVVY